jgi:hypothetical protein
MNQPQRSQTVIVALAAALLIPRIQRWTGVTLTLDDIAALMAGAVAVWHGAGALIERYFPPPRAIEAASVPLVNPSPGAKI